VDVTETTLSAGFRESALGFSGWTRDVNGDGLNDLIKQDLASVRLVYNGPTGPFATESTAYTGAAYSVSAADLNHDAWLDLIVSDDGADRYLLNQGPTPEGKVSFLSYPFSFAHGGFGGPAADEGFAGNNIYRNLTGPPGGDVVLQE